MATRSPHRTKKAAKDFKKSSGPVGGIAVARGKAANQMVSQHLKKLKKEAIAAVKKRGSESIGAFNRMVESKQIRGFRKIKK